VSSLASAAEIASICSVTVLPFGALLAWAAKHWIDKEIVSKLSNDDTPVAKYAHDARDYSRQSWEAVLELQKTVLDHVTDRDAHVG
jgi:hypothetical protein